ncbi:hypothetical protein GDO81_014355 [Engystomops pustulosus]|uniref:Uncharacterized protein n=1 Tax=Engystomops pustulosus TaxID=76066 RepID=A0AAV7BA39_ENGPU|nr:hypothetical protein GDO81_014355 [Engystomops pustulosus]
MLAKVLAITLVCTIAGVLGDVASNILVDAILSYFDQSTLSTKDSTTSQVQVSDLSSVSNALALDGVKSLNADLLNKVSFFAKDIYEQVTQDSEKLQLELEQLKVKLLPYSEEVTRLLSRTTEELRITLNPYAEELQTQVETITLDFVKKLESINLDLTSGALSNSMMVSLVMYSQKLEAKTAECFIALKKVIGTCTEEVKKKIDLQVLSLYQSLSPLAGDMQSPLKKNLENLNYLMKKSVFLIEREILDTTATLEKQISLCATLLKEKNSLFFRNVRKTIALCLFNMNQKINGLKAIIAPYGEAIIKSVVSRVENLQNLLDASVAVSLIDQKDYLEKNIYDKINELLNSTLMTTPTRVVTE